MLPHFRAAARSTALTGLSTLERFRKEGQSTPIVHFVYLHFAPSHQLPRLYELVRLLKRDYEIISYTEAVTKVQRGSAEGRYAALSFDDGFASCLDAGSLLREEGISACFFVCPDAVGRPRRELEPFFPGTGLGDEVRTMSWAEIEALLASGHEVGSHTMTHRTLAELTTEDAKAEIVTSRERLSERFGTVRHFAWPRGTLRHFGPELSRLVRDAGYTSCASAIRGAHQTSTALSFPMIRREHIDLGWPTSHWQYFLKRGRRLANPRNGDWPVGWSPDED